MVIVITSVALYVSMPRCSKEKADQDLQQSHTTFHTVKTVVPSEISQTESDKKVVDEMTTGAASETTIQTGSAEKVCPENSVRLSTGCYFFIKDKPRTFLEGYTYCHQHITSFSTGVVTIESQQENDAIVNYLKTQHSPS